jgi:hypothetical protein
MTQDQACPKHAPDLPQTVDAGARKTVITATEMPNGAVRFHRDVWFIDLQGNSDWHGDDWVEEAGR